jgi:hypothetical protein
MTGFTDQTRNDEICRRHAAGESGASLARAFALSTTRIQQIVDTSKRRCREQLQALGITVRAWNILGNMGVVQRDELETLTREALIARLATVDLADIGARKNCGLDTLRQLATLLERPLPVRPPKKPREATTDRLNAFLLAHPYYGVMFRRGPLP